MLSAIIGHPNTTMRPGRQRSHLALVKRRSKPRYSKFQKKMNQIDVVDFESCEAWAPLAEAFVGLTRDTPAERDRVRKFALHWLVTIVGSLDQPAIKQLGHRSDWPTLREYERFSMLVSSLARIGEVDNNSSELLLKMGPCARAAIYFGFASKLRLDEGNQAAIEMLASAIKEAPHEPVHYYFRARWNYENRLFSAVTNSQGSSPEFCDIKQIAQDLETAINLDFNWKEPRGLLDWSGRRDRRDNPPERRPSLFRPTREGRLMRVPLIVRLS